MKTIGLIGGMSWESSLEYYRIINQEIKKRLGGLHSAECLMYSFDLQLIERLQHQGDWKGLTELMVEAGRTLERGGAGFIVICTNTMHKMADQVQEEVGLPLLHIADATAVQIKKKKMKTVGLLGTRFTMEEDFYRERLKKKHSLEVIIPEKEERDVVHAVVYEELCLGEIKEKSRGMFRRIIDNLVQRGAEGVILGCTEIPLLIEQKDYETALFDTTAIHARAAVEFALTD